MWRLHLLTAEHRISFAFGHKTSGVGSTSVSIRKRSKTERLHLSRTKRKVGVGIKLLTTVTDKQITPFLFCSLLLSAAYTEEDYGRHSTTHRQQQVIPLRKGHRWEVTLISAWDLLMATTFAKCFIRKGLLKSSQSQKILKFKTQITDTEEKNTNPAPPSSKQTWLQFGFTVTRKLTTRQEEVLGATSERYSM